MEIKTGLRIGGSVSIILVISLGSILLLGSLQVAREIEEERIAVEIAEGVFELNILTNDYLLHGEERAQEQWQLRHDSLTEILSSEEVSNLREKAITDEMRRNHADLGDIFSQLTVAGASKDLQEASADQMSIRSQSMVSSAFQLAEEHRQAVEVTQQRAVFTGIIFLGILAGATIANSWGLSRSLLGPIRKMTQEMEEVSLGKLESKTGSERNDELGRLGQKVRRNLKQLFGERAKAIKELEHSNKLLQRSNRDLESYSYVVSHDLKAPLRSIQSFSSFLVKDYGNKLDNTGIEYLTRIARSANHMDVLIKSLLTLSRVGHVSMEMESVDLNNTLDEIITDLDVTRKVEVVDKLPTIHVQKIWIKQLFMNLISNGLKFNQSEKPKIEVLYQERAEDHLFSVRDNGIGIEEKYHERIFRLFEGLHARERYEGVGAGLAISKKIVNEMRGRIWVDSTAGEGSTFYFAIPRSA